MGRSHREAARRLYEIAETQQGFFTTKQAEAAGFAGNTHPYHLQVGDWVREYRGIYRLVQFPPAEHPDLVLWSLWSKNRKQETEGVYSHQTALSVHGLSDANPSKLHMTVPTRFSRSSEIPGVLVLHYADIAASDVATVQGYKCTRPLRTILDLAEEETVGRSFIRQALRQALQRGLITREQMRSAQLAGPGRKIIAQGGESIESIISDPDELRQVAKRVVWFKPPEETLKEPTLFLAHLMMYGTLADVGIAMQYYSDEDFDAVLSDPPAGVFDLNAWNYWNLRYHHEPVPPLPSRHPPSSDDQRV